MLLSAQWSARTVYLSCLPVMIWFQSGALVPLLVSGLSGKINFRSFELPFVFVWKIVLIFRWRRE